MASSITKYLNNLKDKGNLCQLGEVSSTDNPLVTGKIIQVYPLVKKSKFQPQNVLVFHLKEVYVHGSVPPTVFKVVFVDRAAHLVSILNLCIGDHLSFCHAKLFSDASYTRSYSFYPKLLIVGLPHRNSIDHLYYKRKNTDRWSLANPSQCSDPVSTPSNICADPVTSAPNVCNDPVRPTPNICDISARPASNVCDIPARPAPNVCGTPAKPASNIHVIPLIPTSNVCDDPVRPEPNISDDLVSYERTDEKIKSGSSSAASKSDNERPNAVVNNLYRYVKLAAVEKNSKVNVYAIILKILKKPAFFPSCGKYHCMINVIDETKTDEFFVHIFTKNINEFPPMKPYDIIRFHRLQIEEHGGKKDGRVFKGRDVLVLDKEDTNIVYTTSKSYSWSESDHERVNELKEYLLENVSECRSFTTLEKLELKRQKIDLSGQIVQVKVYEDHQDHQDHPIVALRIRDGTKCTVPFFRLSFTVESREDILKKGKVHDSESEEIDIVVSGAANNFKKLKSGELIELFNVQAVVEPVCVKNVRSEHLRFYMKGNWDNIKCNMKENRVNVKCTSLKRTRSRSDVSTPTKNSQSEEIARKRRLHNPDESSITFEDDDFEMNNFYDENRNESNDTARHPENAMNAVDENPKQSISETVDVEDNQNDHLINEEKNVANNVDAVNQKQSTSKAIDQEDNQNDCLVNKEKNIANVDAENPKQATSKAMDEVNNQNDRPTNKEKNINNNNDCEEESSSEAQCCTADRDAPVINTEKNIIPIEENETVSTSEVQHEVNQNDIINTENNDLTSTNEILSSTENCEKISTPCESSTENNEDFAAKWPTNPPYKPFKVKVHILTTTPRIEENSSDDDILLLVHHFCDRCRNFYNNKSKFKWSDKDESSSIPLCPKCENDDLQRLLRLEMLVTEHSEGIPVVIMEKYAEEFLGCTLDDFCKMEEQRCKVKNLIVSYLHRIWKSADPLIFKITPFQVHTNASKPEYHVTGVYNLNC